MSHEDNETLCSALLTLTEALLMTKSGNNSPSISSDAVVPEEAVANHTCDLSNHSIGVIQML